MQHKLRVFLYSLLLFCGASLFAQQAAYAQATVLIEEIKNSCGTQNNGTFQITVTGGTAPFSAVIVVPSTSYFNSIPLTMGVPEIIGMPLPPGDIGLPPDNNILISVSDGDFANPNFSTNIQILSVPPITSVSTSKVDNGDNTCLNPNGSITINSISGGSGSFDFSWTGPNGFNATTQDITNIGGGDYTVTVTDQTANCVFTSATITITDPAPSPFTISSPDLTPCANGDITVNLSLAEPGVEYRLYVDGNPTTTAVVGPVSSLIHPGLPEGSYTISVLATLGTCTPRPSTNTLAFDLDEAPTSAVVGGNAEICQGASADVSVTITGGTGPYSFTIDNGVGALSNYTSGTPIPVSPALTTTYSIIGNVTDANGCTVAGTGSATVTVNALPTAALSGGGEYCVDSPRPTVTLTFTGAPPFNFTYTDGVTPVTVNGHNALTYDILNALPATYAVTALSDDKSCVATALGTPVTVTENPLPTAATSGGGTVCAGVPLPGVTFSFTGTAPFDFTYTDGTTPVTVNGHNNPTFTIANAPAGSYSVTALTDGKGCVASDLGGDVDVIVNPLPTASVSGGGAYCEGSALPTVTFTFTGTAPFDFTYTDGTTPVSINDHPSLTFQIANAPEGTYSITSLTDDNGCAATTLGTPLAVVEHPRPTAAVAGGGTVCADATLPNVTFTFTGTAPFDFTYTNGATPVTVNGHNNPVFTIINAPAGTYSVTALTDANACAATALGGNASVIVNPLPTASISGGGAVCAGAGLPGVTFSFTGKAPFDFTYSNGTTTVTINNHNFPTFSISNAAPGTYSVTALADDNGCVAADLGTPVAVVQNPLPTASSSGGGSVCSGAALPDVTFTFTGSAPFNFTYTNGTTPVTVNNHNSNVFTVSNATPGSYSVTALTDANGCVATNLGGATQVIENPLPTAVIGGGGTICDGATLPSVTFTFTGAIPFDFTYTDGTNTFTILDNSSTFTITNATPGTYAITALTDNNGCVATNLGTPVSVVENPLPTAATSGGGIVCAGDDLPTVTFTFTGTAPYNFTYTDGGTVVSISGHNSNSFAIADATAGTYSVTALSDANGCVAADLGGDVDVAVNPLPTASAGGGGVFCAGSPQPTVTFTFTGAIPFDFTYTDGTTPVTINGHNSLTFNVPNAPEGSYSVTALIDNNGCDGTSLGTPVVVTEDPLPTGAVSGGGTVCAGDELPDVTFTFTGTAPFAFTYTDGTTPVSISNHNSTAFTISNAAEGIYSLIALADNNGCVATDLGGNADVIVNDLPTVVISGGGGYCAGTSAPTVTFTFTGALPFNFTYTDGTLPVVVNNHNSLTFDITNPAPGTYAVSALTDNNGCAATSFGTPVSVTENALPVANTGGGGTACSDGVLPDVTFTFTGTAPFDFTYTDGSTPVTVNAHNTNSYTITSAAAGSYSVTALTDATGCVGTVLGGSVDVVVEPAATVEAGNAQMICAGDIATLNGSSFGGSASGATWSIVEEPVGGDGALSDESETALPSAITFTATVEGNYRLRLTTNNPAGLCDVAADEVIITVTAGAVVDAGSPQTICESATAQLGATFSGTTGVTWSTSGDGSFDDASLSDATYTPGANDKANGTVTLTVTTAGPCAPETDDVVITIEPDPVVDAGPVQTICSSQTITLNASFGGSATGLQWSSAGDGSFDDNTDPNATYTPGINDMANGSVTLTATATGSCNGFTDNVVITINPVATVDAGIPQTVCIGNPVTLAATIGGSASTLTWSTSGDGSFDDVNDPNAVYTAGPNDLVNGTVTLTTTTNNPAGPCPAANDNVVINYIPTPGDQTTPGNETWIGYVYDDSGDPTAYPGKVDFHTSKYRGFIDAADIAGMTGTSSYDVTTDKFDLSLGIADALQGPNVCGSYTNNFSVRYRMEKNFAAGVYRFMIGSDDGVRLLIDGVDYTPTGGFDIHAYTVFTTDPVCLSGTHVFELQYFDNTAHARLTFDYMAVPVPDTNGPIQACVDSPAPTLTISSPDTDVQSFDWYKDGTLVFTGENYTPSTADLDMSVATTTTFTVIPMYACGPAPGVDVVVEVLSGATLTITPQTICESGGIVNLTDFVDATPTGGTFTFSGHPMVAGNTFNPAGLAGSTISIAVNYSNGSCTAPQGTLNLTITNSSSITVPASQVSICDASGMVDLASLVSGVPSGGTFTFAGPQVSGNNFDPAGLSGLQTITVDYTIGGCAAPQTTFEIDVIGSASIATSNTVACQTGAAVNLLSLVTPTPAGGTFTFTGSGVSGSMFNPFGQSGVVNINVEYDFNGCTDNGVIQITVLGPTDPLCAGGNCANVVIVPKDEPATCTNSDGRLVMSIKPFTPAVNNTGVKITIDGTSSTGLHITRTIFNDSVFNALPVGSYTYLIEYGDPSCIKNGTFSIDQSGTVGSPTVANITSPTCFGTATGSVILNVTGEAGNILEWSLDGGLTDPFKPFTVGTQITGIPAGPAPTFQRVISVRRNIADVCFASVSFTMSEAVTALSATFNVSAATCNGNDGAITNIVATGGNGAPYTFSIDGGQTFHADDRFNGLAGGNYSVRVRDGAGCESDFPATVTFPGFINALVDKTDGNCSNGGGTGAIRVIVTDPGSFQVALSTDQFNPPADAEYVPYNNPFVSFDELERGQYFVYIKSNNTACATRTAPINILGVYDITFDIVPYCENNEVSLLLDNVTGEAGGAPLEIQISKKFTSAPPEIIYQQFPANGEVFLAHNDYTFLQTPGEYTIKIIQFQFEVVCNLSSQVVDFSVPSPLAASIGEVSQSYPDVPSGELRINTFTGGAHPYEVRIELDSASSFSLPIHSTQFEEAHMNGNQQLEAAYNNIPPGRYIVEVKDSVGCMVDLIARVPLDVGLYIPNIFTPNGDGSNDVFFIRNLPQETGENRLTITNRWGKKVFQSENYQNNWEGADTTDGIYFYRLDLAGGETLTGWVEIMRGPKP